MTVKFVRLLKQAIIGSILTIRFENRLRKGQNVVTLLLEVTSQKKWDFQTKRIC